MKRATSIFLPNWSHYSKNSSYNQSMKTLLLIPLLMIALPAAAELEALDGKELENELAVSDVTAFQAVHTPQILSTANAGSDDDLRIQQEVNALRLAPGQLGAGQHIRLENQLLQGPTSGIEVHNGSDTGLNF